MLIDTHCHIDLYNNPEKILQECERRKIAILSMTNLPSHFELGFPFFKNAKYARIALGLHPLYAEKHKPEFPKFLKNIDKTSYIGEIGLDFSIEGIKTKEIQLEYFEQVLKHLANKKKILSIHSRKAEKEVLELLVKHKISNAIFHWYSGNISLIDNIVNEGYYFSINPNMINSENGRKIILRIPIERILLESDGPFIQINNKEINPWDLNTVVEFIANSNKLESQEVSKLIELNFFRLINNLK